MQETVLERGLSSRMGGCEEEGGMAVRQEGASPVVVGSYGERRLSVAGDRVDAGARGPLEAGVCPLRDRVQVYQAPEVESPQERLVAYIIGAPPKARLPKWSTSWGTILMASAPPTRHS